MRINPLARCNDLLKIALLTVRAEDAVNKMMIVIMEKKFIKAKVQWHFKPDLTITVFIHECSVLM